MSEIQLAFSKAINDERMFYYNNLKSRIKIYINPETYELIYKQAYDRAQKGLDKTEICMIDRMYYDGQKSKTLWSYDIEDFKLKVISVLDEINEEWTKRYAGTQFEFVEIKSRGVYLLEIVLKVLPME